MVMTGPLTSPQGFVSGLSLEDEGALSRHRHVLDCRSERVIEFNYRLSPVKSDESKLTRRHIIGSHVLPRPKTLISMFPFKLVTHFSRGSYWLPSGPHRHPSRPGDRWLPRSSHWCRLLLVSEEAKCSS